MRWNLILLAAGYSRRFGDRKLLAEINGTPLYRFSLDKKRKLSEKLGDSTILVVTSYPEIEAYCRKQSVTVIKMTEQIIPELRPLFKSGEISGDTGVCRGGQSKGRCFLYSRPAWT